MDPQGTPNGWREVACTGVRVLGPLDTVAAPESCLVAQSRKFTKSVAPQPDVTFQPPPEILKNLGKYKVREGTHPGPHALNVHMVLRVVSSTVVHPA